MRRHFAEELEELRERVVYMGGLVESAVHRSVRALVDRNVDLADKIIREVEPEINRLEVEIDETVLRLMALQQPMAVDLRFLAAVLKITNDLERMGDLAVNICQAITRIQAQPASKPLADIPLMADRAEWMVRNALDSLISRDVEKARAVLKADDAVDAMRDRLLRELVTRMRNDPEVVEPALSLILVARNLERIADHATNIAEDVIFWIEAVDVRHHMHEHA